MKKNKRKKKFKYRRLVRLILILAVIICLCIWLANKKPSDTEEEPVSNNDVVIENPEVNLNAIPGQTLIDYGDGYTNVFTNSKSSRTYIEYKQNLGSWARKHLLGRNNGRKRLRNNCNFCYCKPDMALI